MVKNYVLISKDAMCRDYLHFYGSCPWQKKTPNLDELVEKGTLFLSHYTAAPSTVMSFYSMATGKFAHETDYQMYERAHLAVTGDTLFTKVKLKGYDECHIIWDDMWDVLQEYYDYFRQDVNIHSVHDLRESVGVHKKTSGELFEDNEKAYKTLSSISKMIEEILSNGKSNFIWLHLPHVLSGRAAYGSDMDIFDEYVGMVRKFIPDDCISVTADHGNMNGFRGKLAYGFDVYDKAIRIPLITPRIDGLKECSDLTSSVDLFDLLFESKITHRKFVYSDSAYRAQNSRKLAIISNGYKYIYTKKDNSEELYDLAFDPLENFSLISDVLFDVDRKINISIREEYYYTKWSDLEEVRKQFREEKKRIWRDGTFSVIMKSKLKDLVRPFYNKLKKAK